MIFNKKFKVYYVIGLMMILFSFITQFNLMAEEVKPEAKPEVKPVVQKIQEWLLLGPVEIPAAEAALLKNDNAILNFNQIAITDLNPITGGKLTWDKSTVLTWNPLKPVEYKAKEAAVYFLAAYIEPARWLQTQFVLEHKDLKVSAFMDGKPLSLKSANDKMTADIDLSNEKHLLVLKVLVPKGTGMNLAVNASLQNKEAFQADNVKFSLDPFHKVQIEHILNMIEVDGPQVSPDGKRVVVYLRQTLKDSGKFVRWMEILDIATGSTVFSSKDLGNYDNFQWMGNGSDRFSYAVSDKEESTIYQFNLNTNQAVPVLKNVKNLSGYQWSPDLSFILYNTYSKKEGPTEYKYIDTLRDRTRFATFKNTFFIYYPVGGVIHQVTDETQNFGYGVISPDGKSIMFAKDEEDDKNRPYGRKTFFLYDIASMTSKKMFDGNFFQAVTWSPDSKKWLVLGGPSAFDGIGKNLKDPNMIPNDYDYQAFFYDLATQAIEPISKNFDPSLKESYWYPGSPSQIYFRVDEKENINLYSYTIKDKTYKRYALPVEVISNMDIAYNKNIAVFSGSSAVIPSKLYKLDLMTGKAALLKDYNAEAFKYVRFGTVEDWNFKSPAGLTIYGRIHYPADFDKTKQYPCIVYYYGGTSSVNREYGGRYPKDWYTTMGYIVYVLQPSGSVGFGQDFSAAHVNDWGKTTAEEIIFGVKQLLKEHSCIDPKRLGAMGASYGGFMTQYLATQTDIFAAYISHAGISDLTSYWGVGDFGYLYSGIATADAFPWNRKDIYVGHSPLYMADRIKSPLLLLHGSIDNNVPPGESYQMFTALKLLGKNVVLITFKDQQHFILEYKKRIQWMNTIMAWWDKYLKNQSEFFDNMYQKND